MPTRLSAPRPKRDYPKETFIQPRYILGVRFKVTRASMGRSHYGPSVYLSFDSADLPDPSRAELGVNTPTCVIGLLESSTAGKDAAGIGAKNLVGRTLRFEAVVSNGGKTNFVLWDDTADVVAEAATGGPAISPTA